MTIRVFLGLLFMGAFLIATALIAASGLFLQGQLTPLIANIDSTGTLTDLIVFVSVGSFLFVVVMIAIMFMLIGSYVAKPVRNVTAAMHTFTETGTKPEAALQGWMPSEVKSLAESFSHFADRASEVHKHDVEISRVKSDFISTAAHQLRTPLTGIRWALEALELEPLTESQKSLVASATEKSRQLVSVVGTLLDISSIESGKYAYDMKETALDSIVEEVTKDFRTLAAQSNVSLLFEKTGTQSARVSVDRERIRWVLNNLIENAIRYTPISGSVRITTELAPGRAYVKVRDTGIGIAPGDKGNIFERFYRAPNAITKQNGGNGLGLYIARTIANDHGGDLNFSSNEAGPGTTFTLSLPLV